MAEPQKKSHRARNLCIFAGCALAWLILDQLVKAFCEGQGLGAVIVPNILGLVRIHVVHNFGAAWSMFEGNVFALAVIGVVICTLLIAFALYESKHASVLEMASVGLVFAGGIGNLIDRVSLGYVVDMIEPIFINFPTFNVADMGVTCGIALLFVSIALQFVQETKHPSDQDPHKEDSLDA